MRNNIKSESKGLYSLTEIFQDNIFRIPDYQRGYAWGLAQVQDLWDDINLIQDGSFHYTGMITAQIPHDRDQVKWRFESEIFFRSESDSLDLPRPLYITDGQQRIITLIILLSVLKNSLPSNTAQELEETFLKSNELLKLSYEMDMPGYYYLAFNVLGNISTSQRNEKNAYTINMKNARLFFVDKLKNSNQKEIVVLYDKVINKLLFNFFIIPEKMTVFTIFETMNTRGKRLSDLELLKNRLMYLVSLSSEEDYLFAIRGRINQAWNTIYLELAREGNTVLSDDRFLRVHWTVYFNLEEVNAFTKKQCREFLFYFYFTKERIHNQELSMEDILSYIESLESYSKYFFKLHRPYHPDCDFPHEIKKWISKIVSLPAFSTFEPLILAALLKELEGGDRVILTKFLQSIERYLFLVFCVGKYRLNTNQKVFLLQANNFKEGNMPLSKLTSALDIKHYDSRSQRSWIKRTVSKNLNIDMTPGAILDRFQSECDRYRSDEGFRSWRYIQYFLQEYEDSISLHVNFSSIPENPKVCLVLPSSKKIPLNDTAKARLHRVYNLKRQKNWNNCLKNFGEAGQQYLTYSLGNILLSNTSSCAYDRENAEPDDFQVRKHEFLHRAKQPKLQNEYEVFVKEEWTPETILGRGMKMLDFMQSRWDIRIDKKQMKQIIYLNRIMPEQEEYNNEEDEESGLNNQGSLFD